MAPVKPGSAPKASTSKAAPAPKEKSGFGKAQPRGLRGVYLCGKEGNQAATYTLKINKLTRKLRSECTDPQKKESSIIEFEVVASDNEKCPVGFIGSIVFTDKYFEDSYFSDVKGFLCGLLNKEPEDVDEEDWDGAMRDAAQPYAGCYVDVVAIDRARKDKHDITNYVFSPNAEQHPAE